MRILGIDFGLKRVGLALTDPTQTIATPYRVLMNKGSIVHLAEQIAAICQEEEVEKIVLGESLNYAGEPNTVMIGINKLAEELSSVHKLEVILEPEFLTSREAAREIGEDDQHDARAAAIILRSYLDKIHSRHD